MIVICPSCKKKFQIDGALIPEEGRDLQCGSCTHVWLYNVENENSSPLTLSENFVENEVSENLAEKDTENKTDNKEKSIQERPKNKEKKIEDISNKKKSETKKESTGGKFFSYIIVLIISFVALIILLDTLKTSIINVFPGIEIILFNLFETLKDIKLFIIDLS